MSTFLIVEPNGDLSADMSNYFRGIGHSVFEAPDGAGALAQLEQHECDVVVSNAAVPGGSVVELIRAVKKRNRGTVVIVTADINAIPEGVLAMKEGAFSILHSPFSLPELNFQIKRALENRDVKSATTGAPLRRVELYQPYNFIGESPKIKHVFSIVSRVARSDSSVVILGETGTGKELVAGAIHYNSPRAGGPFVRVNCAALPEHLLESELFGHEKGSFTGADRKREGRFEHANRGTIFLDEVADMSLSTQAKILRVIQEKEFERLGSNETMKTDVRLISATNRDLMERMRKNLFREDLYYRLNVVSIRLPPLRERNGDIALLIQFFLKKFATEMNKRITGIAPEAMKRLLSYPWPGNIRELENALERAVLLAEGDTIISEDLDLYLPGDSSREGSRAIQLPPEGIRLEEAERDLIVQALERCSWVQKNAAALLGISSRALNYRVKNLNLTHPSWKKNR
jgi:DNA-binding NtrC family response regulator